jgi:hypothetical protein
MRVGTKGVSLPLVVCIHLSTPAQADPKGENVHLVDSVLKRAEDQPIYGFLNYG